MHGAIPAAGGKRKLTGGADDAELQGGGEEVMMKVISYVVVIIAAVCMQSMALADAPDYICTPVSGTHVFNFDNAEKTITDADKDKAGIIIENAFSFDLAGTFTTTGCGIKAPGYITTTSDLPVIGLNSDGGNWYQINEYIGVAMKGWIEGNVQKYFPVPFISQSNNYNTDSQDWKSGSKGIVSIQILKPFVGFSYFSQVIMHTQIARTPNVGTRGPYVSELMMSGQIIVPQTCELDTGQTVTMYFGDIGASAFPQAGAGNRPAGVNPQTHSIAIQCKNIDAQAMLSLRVEADKVSGNAIVSDNPDLGFVVANGKQNPLTPNTIDSKIPFQLDDSGAATVPVSAWPVSVTGNKPAEGKFTSEGYLRVDFD
ncbi:fimbrial protein [Enterobacter cancerogenus]|uniref:fimbrial protein n=1 Tax=Enterobacter cancerogenus TaxID=69218 RepID=UPI004059F5E2